MKSKAKPKFEPRRPPADLSAAAREWWEFVLGTWELDSGQIPILTAALQSWDRLREAQAVLRTEGLVIRDRFQQQRPHPCVAIERDARTALIRAWGSLGLDYEQPAGPIGRPQLGYERNRR